MKKILLVSSFVDALDVFKTFAGANYKDKIVTFIPTASNPEEVFYFVESAKVAFENLGLIVDVLDLSTASAMEIEGEIQGTHFIYVTGGNSFFLLQELRRTGADKILIEQIESGKPYIGEAAGAVVLAHNIEYIKDMDDRAKAPTLTSFEGLAMVRFYPLPHSHTFPFQEIVKRIISTYGEALPLCPFSNTQAIIVEGESFEVVHA